MSDYITFDRQDLNFQNEIGKGGFSTVYRVEWKTDKYISKLRLNSQFAAAKKLNRVDDIELKILSKLSHPNIVKLIGVVDAKPRYYLILELCEGGSLYDYLSQSTNEPVNKPLAYCWVEQSARAIQFLQKNNVIHRDIKSHNFLITRSNNLKLTDFGISKISDVTVTTAVKGTWAWVAPEVFIEEHLSPLSDIYSYGIVVWEIFTKQKPFEGCEYQNVMWRVCEAKERPPIPDTCPEEIAELLRQCWSHDRKARPGIGIIVRKVTEYRKTVLGANRLPLPLDSFAFTEIIVDIAGKQSKYEIPYGTTVQCIKETIARSTSGGGSCQLKLLYQDKELDNGSTLQDHLIADGDVISALQHTRLRFTFENGNTVVTNVSPEDTFHSLKTRLNHIGSVYFTTAYRCPLKDQLSPAYYGIKCDASLLVVTQPYIRIQKEEGIFFSVKTSLNETVGDLKKRVQHQHLILREKLYSTILEFGLTRSSSGNPMALIGCLRSVSLQDDNTIQASGIRHGDIVCMMNLQYAFPLPEKFGWLSERIFVAIPSLTEDDVENIIKLSKSLDAK